MQTILVNLYEFDPIRGGGTTRVARVLCRMLADLAHNRQARVIYAVSWQMTPGFSEWVGASDLDIIPCLPNLNLSTLIKSLQVDYTISPFYWMFPFDPPRKPGSPAHVVLIADTIPLEHPQLFPTTDVDNSTRVFSWCQNAACVVTPSNHARDSLLRMTALKPEQLAVIPWAGQLTAEPEPVSPPVDSLQPFVFYPANGLAHKRHRLLLQIMQQVWTTRPEMKLVLTGYHEPGYILDLCHEVGCSSEQVIDLSFVSDGQLVTLYRNAEAMLFTSMHEGFGLPLLEAMDQGCPIICAPITSIPEVAGDAAIYVSSENPQDWADALLHNLPEMRNLLIDAGRKRAATFSWTRVSEQWLQTLCNAGLQIQGPEADEELQVPLTSVQQEISSWADAYRQQQYELVAKENEIQKLAGIAHRQNEELEAKERVIQEFNFVLRPVKFLLEPLIQLVRWGKKQYGPQLTLQPQYPPRPVRIPSWYSAQSTYVPLPKISIVTPSYNQSDYLEETIQSVLDQHYSGLEYIIQDGRSTDNSLALLQKYADQLTFFESTQDDGQAHAINKGFSRASGEIMAYLNSDDFLLPGSLAYIGQYFASHPQVDAVYGHRILIDEESREIGRWVLPPHDPITLTWADFIPQETLFWRRQIWEKVGAKIDESYRFAMDWDLLIRFQVAGARIIRLPRFLGAFRVHDQQKSSTLIHDIGEDEMQKIRERCHQRPVTALEVNLNIKRYRLKSALYHQLYRMGLARY